MVNIVLELKKKKRMQTLKNPYKTRPPTCDKRDTYSHPGKALKNVSASTSVVLNYNDH